MSTHDEPFTLEDLTEVYRREKGSRNLVAIRPDFYRVVKTYTNQLRKTIASEFSIDGYSAKAKLASTYLSKAQECIDEIFRFRFKKVLEMALRVAMNGKANLKNLTQEELEFYNSAVVMLKEKYTFLNGESTISIEKHTELLSQLPTSISKQDMPSASEPEPIREESEILEVPREEQSSDEDVSDETSLEDDFSEEPPILPPSETIEPAEVVEEKTIDAQISGVKILVRIAENIPDIAGVDRNYRLKKEDIVALPASIAKILISQKAAFPINTTFIE